MSLQPELLIDGLSFAEAPRWHDGPLWCSDFYTHQVLRIDAAGRAEAVLTVPGQPSGLGWLPDGRLLVVSMLDRRLLRLDPGGPVCVAELGALAPAPCNDMVVDGTGRAYIGNFGFDFAAGEAPKPTVLICVSPDGRARAVADELLFPNGSVIADGGATLVVAETFGARLTAFDIAEDGSLGRRRIWAALPGLSPDGICLDAEGAIWVASPQTREFVRVREGGQIVQRIASAAPAIACALGGPQGRTLYLASGKVQGAEAALAERGARIDCIEVDVPGVPG